MSFQLSQNSRNSPVNNKSQGSKNSNHKKKDKLFNFFVLPPRVKIPQFPVPKDLVPAVTNNLNPMPGMSEKTLQFIKVLRNVTSSGEFETKENNHLQILKLMLYLEEIQNNLDMRRYDQVTQIIKVKQPGGSEYFKIFIDGLSEERPSVRPEDKIEVRDSSSRVLYRLTVRNVMDDHIIAISGPRFSQKYSAENMYNIRFKFQNYTLRCSHYALTLIDMYKLTPIFFPVHNYFFGNTKQSQFWFNPAIENNPEQKQAVLNISSKSSKPAPYILYGPPGTGKTATLVEAICQAYHNDSSEKILICTPSNAAADVITKRLLQYISDNDIYRMYSPSKEGSRIDEAIVSCSNYVEGQIMMLPKEVVYEKRIVICTLCACVRLLFMGFREKHFAYVFIDEAGQAIEPDSMIPFNLLSSVRDGRIGKLHGQIVIAGDPQQLGPGIRSKIAEPILGKSMLERLMDFKPYTKNEHNQYNPTYITKLLRNYRSHPKIIEVSNKLFYENELKACGDFSVRKAEDWTGLAKPKFPVFFHGVEGTERKNPRSPSVYNVEEIKVVVTYVKLLLGKKFQNTIVTQRDIGIITPFTEQKKKIMYALEEYNYDDIEVGTVELFQGQEKEIIILSTVRNKIFNHGNDDHIGFLSNRKRFNVALTRAKALLIVVGNPIVLQIDIHWRYFLNFCISNKAYKGMAFDFKNETDNLFQHSKSVSKSRKSNPLDSSNLHLIQLDDGVDKSSDSSMEDENQQPNTSANSIQAKFNIQLPKVPVAHGIHKAPRTESLLSDVVIRNMSDLKLEKAAAKKAKKNKKKSQNNEN